MGSGRAALERLITDPRVFIAALVIFAAGNVANWTPDLRPIASMLYGPSLVVIVAFLGKRLDENVLGRALLTTDPYDLYLVHQPFAFGTALLAKFAFHSYAVFLGWFVFVAIATGAARLLTLVQGRLVFRLRPAARKLVPSERVPISVSR
jgi:hypothetical protein